MSHLGKCPKCGIENYGSLHFQHEAVLYVPWFQVNPGDRDENDKEHTGYPTFVSKSEYASQDQQMVASLYPDYIEELRGTFDATTRPFLCSCPKEIKL